MKILITGANGAIGSDLVRLLSKKNKIFAFYRTPNIISSNLKNKNIKWIKQDLKKKIIYNVKPQVIIHGVVAHPFSKKNTYQDYLQSNITSLQNVIEFAKKKKIKKFIYLSSFKIYGDIQSDIIKDCNVFTNPSMLGATKVLAEKMLEIQKFAYLNIRLPGVISYYINDYRRPWLNNIIYKLKKNQPIKIYNAQKVFNNVIDTIEIYKFINHIIKKKNMISGSFNLSAKKPIKIKNMIYYIKNKISSKSKISFVKKKSNHFIISSNKAFNDYGFNIASTTEIVNRYVKNYASFSLIDNCGKY